MTDRLELVLAQKVVDLDASAGEPNWADVRRKARRITTRTLALRLGSGGAVVLLAVLAATPALGLRGQVVRLFSSGEPAPPRVVTSFAQIDMAAPPGMATGVIASETRDVMEVPLSTGETAVLWVAPTRSGGFCEFVSPTGRHSTGGGGCDRDRLGRFGPGLMIPGPISPTGTILQPPVIIDGQTLIRGAAQVEVEYEDGDRAKTPVVWVSSPIDAGFFVYEVPASHWRAGHRPTALTLVDADGNELARSEVHLNDFLRAVETTRSVEH